MPTVSDAPARPLSITRIAADHGLLTAEVRTLINEHRVPTYRLGNARLMDPADWDRLRPLVRRYVESKAAVTPA